MFQSSNPFAECTIVHPMRREVERFQKIYEVAIKKENDTILEDHFLRDRAQRCSEYKIVAVTAEVELICIPFANLTTCLYSYSKFKDKFVQVCEDIVDRQRHLWQIKVFKELYFSGLKAKDGQKTSG